MPYVRQTWINGETHLDADHMNYMEDGIERVNNRLDVVEPTISSAIQASAEAVAAAEDAAESAEEAKSFTPTGYDELLDTVNDLTTAMPTKITNPSGGVSGQYLQKTDAGTQWADASGGGTAEHVTYDNSTSGLKAVNVQEAVDENATAIVTLNNNLASVNIASVTRIATTVTTDTTGNIALPYSPYSNDGKKYVVAPFALQTSYLRAWVARANNSWYLTAVNPNTGATINNTSLDIRYLLITLKPM